LKSPPANCTRNHLPGPTLSDLVGGPHIPGFGICGNVILSPCLIRETLCHARRLQHPFSASRFIPFWYYPPSTNHFWRHPERSARPRLFDPLLLRVGRARSRRTCCFLGQPTVAVSFAVFRQSEAKGPAVSPSRPAGAPSFPFFWERVGTSISTLLSSRARAPARVEGPAFPGQRHETIAYSRRHPERGPRDHSRSEPKSLS